MPPSYIHLLFCLLLVSTPLYRVLIASSYDMFFIIDVQPNEVSVFYRYYVLFSRILVFSLVFSLFYFLEIFYNYNFLSQKKKMSCDILF